MRHQHQCRLCTHYIDDVLPRAPLQLCSCWGYGQIFHNKVLLIKIFLVLDIDGDGIISREDMDGVLDLMTDNAMDDELKDRIINGVGKMCLLALML